MLALTELFYSVETAAEVWLLQFVWHVVDCVTPFSLEFDDILTWVVAAERRLRQDGSIAKHVGLFLSVCKILLKILHFETILTK